jgi:ABC-type dipeptide/oligopeptide/nickel transport system permease component
VAYFLFRRTLGFVLTLLAVSVVVFAVMNVLPGDPALTILGMDASEDALAALREQLGLNAPLVTRYFSWVWNALQGDFGISHSFRVPVSELISERLPMTRETIFDLASLTKNIATTTAIMRLVDAGEVALDDSVAKYLPTFAERFQDPVMALEKGLALETQQGLGQAVVLIAIKASSNAGG